MMVKLFDYQQEVLDSSSPLVIMNWARGLGKTFTIANYILEKKPNKVVVIGDIRQLGIHMKQLLERDENFKSLVKNWTISRSENKIELAYFNGWNTKIKQVSKSGTNTEGNVKHYLRGERVDLFVFEGQIPTEKTYSEIKNGFNAKVVCSVTMNNYNGSIEGICASKHLIQADYRAGLENNVYTQKEIDKFRSERRKEFYDQFAILDNHCENKEEMPFNDFKAEAERSLQKQFLDTPATKDTVLTRMNIIKMLKELQSM